MPRRSVPLAPVVSNQHRSIIVITFMTAIVLAVFLTQPRMADSANQGVLKNDAARGTQKKSPRKQKARPATEEASQTATRGIVATDVPDFKADTSAHALIIGISSYANLRAQDQLKFADADAQALRNFLVSDKGGFKESNVVLLLNEQATRAEILRELSRLQTVSGPTSLVLVFFAGHGVVNKAGQAFLIASDTKADDLHASGLDMITVNTTLQNMRARSVVIMSDACHAAAIANTLNSGTITNLSAKDFDAPSQRQDSSSFIFSAASPSQSSYEDATLRHGLFTHFMLKGLEGESDSDTNGVVTSKELYEYVNRSLEQESRKRNISQIPEYNLAYDRSIPLAITNESGRAEYQKWFKDDPWIARTIASFDEALHRNWLTTPVGHSAWDYYERLKNYVTASAVVDQKRDELLKKIISEADKLIEQSPTDPGRWSQASNNLEKAYQITRDNNVLAKQFFCSVISYSQSGEAARAESKCDATLDLIESGGRTDPLLSVRIGQFYTTLKAWEKSRRAYRLAVSKTSNETWLTEYAEVLVHLSVFDEAETQLRRALTTNPNHLRALIRISDILLRVPKKDRVAEALRHINHARQLKPEDLDSEQVFGRVMLAFGETSKAIDSLLKVARTLPTGEKRDEALFYLSQSYWRSGHLDRAVSALREAEVSGSQNLKVFDLLAVLLDELGDVQGAIGAAQRAVVLTRQKPENAEREHLVAEYFERNGRLVDAAHKYRDAERLSTDAKLRSSWDNRARALYLRSGLNQEANVPRRPSLADIKQPGQSSPIIVPGGLEALARLTGIRLTAEDPVGLARIFDACLRNPNLRSTLIRFYGDYPEFIKKGTMRGSTLSGILNLPSSSQTQSAEAREALKFFGVNDKKGSRQIKLKEFESRRYILEALGGNGIRLQKGEEVTMSFRNDELTAGEGMETWISFVKDGPKAKPEEQLLLFLKDQQAMKLYVGFSLIPDAAAKQFRGLVVTKENVETLPDSLYFAAPYLRFDGHGKLDVPGQRQGESNWQRLLKSEVPHLPLRSLFAKDNGGALYLFCALSSAGDVGNFIARSNSFDQVFRMFDQAKVPGGRSPFDFIDLLRLMTVEKGQLRLPRVADVWRSSPNDTGDPVMRFISSMGKMAPGREIPLVKVLAMLTAIERERPEWTSDQGTVQLIATTVGANKESLLEVALDLEMSKKQLIEYLTLVNRIDSMPASADKTTSLRLFQATFEILRRVSKNSLQPPTRIGELTDQLLKLDPSTSNYGLQVAYFIRFELLRTEPKTVGSEVEETLIALLADAPAIELPPPGKDETGTTKLAPESARLLQVSAVAAEQIRKFLTDQKHTRLGAVLDAQIALDDLDKNLSSAEALTKLKESVAKFWEPEPEPDLKKKKSKKPIVREPTLRETVTNQSVPVSSSTIAAIRIRVSPLLGEALLGQVYALVAGPAADRIPFESDLIRKHDFSASPWGPTQVDASGRITGNLVRLNQAIARVSTAASVFGAPRSAFVEATLSSFDLVRHGWVTRDGHEFVARTMDLGEDVLALYVRADQSTEKAFQQLERFMTQRRALAVRRLVERGEIAAAIREISPSELYALGRIYLNWRLATAELEDLTGEPGALGALARIIARNQTGGESEIPKRLEQAINQFGMTTISRTGLSRLELGEPEPYEFSVGFQDDYRLAERAQDLKLMLVRRAHRLGGGAMFPLSPTLAQKILSNTLMRSRKAAGGTASPERDWKSFVLTIQGVNEKDFTAVVEEIAKFGYVGWVARKRWSDSPVAERDSKSEP